MIAAAWTEFSLNYAHILRAEGIGMFSAGVYAHYHLGHAGAALQFDDLNYSVVDTTQLVMHEATMRYGMAMPAFNAGRGWGADVGVSYERTLEEADGYMPHHASGACDPLRYRYRIGLSLIDLGGFKFHQAEAGTISAGSANLADYTHVNIDDEVDLDSLLSTATNWKRDEAMSIGTPTALSIQYDQRVADRMYVALAAVQQVSGRTTMRLRRTNSIAVTPRFETRYFEAALPLVLHEYDVRHPTVGLMLRFEGIVVGSDHILPFLNRRDVYAADVYFRLHVMLHRSPFCKGKRKNTRDHRAGSKEQIPCSTPNE